VIRLTPIGKVKSPLKRLDSGQEWANIRAKIIIDKKYGEGLEGIEQCKFIWVLYWMHKLPRDAKKKLKTHPRGDTSKPVMGVFALRSPMRPNPIGLSKVLLIKRQHNTLTVEGLDAIDGAPILDIKKYVENEKGRLKG